MALADADDLVPAREAYRHAVAECTALGSSWILPDIQQVSGALHFDVGAGDDALAELDTGLRAAAERGHRVAVTQSMGYQALILAGRGDLRAAELVLGYVEADDLPTMFNGLATSEEPFDRWFRAYALEVHGVPLEDEMPPPEQVLDFSR